MSARTKGILLMLLSALLFSLMNVFVHLAGDIPAMQKTFFRNIVVTIFSIFILYKDHIEITIPKGQRIHMFSRCFFGLLGVICNFYAVDHMLLSDATMLNKIAPFFTILFSALLIKERATWVHYGLSLVALGGCLFVMKPGLGIISPVACIALAGGVLAGLAYTEVRILGVNHVDKDVTVFCFSFFSCIAVIPAIVIGYVPMSWNQTMYLILTGLAATGAQLAVTASYQYASSAVVAVYDYTQIIFSALFGYIIFSQLTDFLSVIGYIVICGAAIALTYYNTRIIKAS